MAKRLPRYEVIRWLPGGVTLRDPKTGRTFILPVTMAEALKTAGRLTEAR